MTDLNVTPTLERLQPTTTMPIRAHADSLLGCIVAASNVAHLLTIERDLEIPVAP